MQLGVKNLIAKGLRKYTILKLHLLDKNIGFRKPSWLMLTLRTDPIQN